MRVDWILFIFCVGLIAYAYVGYPVLVWMAARLYARPLIPTDTAPRAVSVVLAVYNEAATIARRIVELQQQLASLDPASEIIVVSDGSTDGTDQIAREAPGGRVRVIRQSANLGKAAALNVGVAAANNRIIVFGDARQTWAPDAIERLLANYTDRSVGAVSGDLVLRRSDGSLAGVGLYWKLEKWLRRNESRIGSSIGVSGSICSVRRALYVPLPEGVILDDLCWPMSVAMQGYRVIHEPDACAFDQLPDKPRDEMRRKVRTLSGNLQLLRLRPAIIFPWCNPAWFGVISHKLMRLEVPWAMLGAIAACACSSDPRLRAALVAQGVGYAVGILGLVYRRAGESRLVNALSSLLVLNAAAFMAWWVYFTGHAGRAWSKVSYTGDALVAR